MPTKSEAKDLLGIFAVLVVAFSIYMIIQEVSGMKTELLAYAVLAVVFTAALLIKSHYVDPIADQAYAEIYGLEEEGAEW